VGGSTSGNATMLSTKNFPRHFVCEIQYASGIPIAKRMAATEIANRTDSQRATIVRLVPSFLWCFLIPFGRPKSAFLQQVVAPSLRDELHELLCCRSVLP